MTRAVWKYDIPTADAATFAGYHTLIPAQAKFLNCAIQHDQDLVSTWFEVESEMPRVRRYFRVFGTGHTIDDSRFSYLGTTLHFNGSLVLHLYTLYHPSEEITS